MTVIIIALLAYITEMVDITGAATTIGEGGMIGIDDLSMEGVPRMKRLYALIISMSVFLVFSNVSFADQAHENQGKGKEKSGQYHQDNRPQQQQYQHRPEQHPQKQKQHYQNWSGYSGYRGRSPYIKDNRYREHYRQYKYSGHWDRWADWDRYRERNPYIYEHGHYERFENHMFFMFNDGINSFMFSIGK
jgi:hypothetical protein